MWNLTASETPHLIFSYEFDESIESGYVEYEVLDVNNCSGKVIQSDGNNKIENLECNLFDREALSNTFTLNVTYDQRDAPPVNLLQTFTVKGRLQSSRYSALLTL